MEGNRLDGLDLKELTSGFRERMRRLALFEPLHELERKREQDLEGKMIDMRGLGLLTLLFFFENKLLRQTKVGVKELAIFLKKMTEHIYLIKEEKYEDIARNLITTFRPTTGKRKSFSYFDWEYKQDDTIDYSILKANSFDMETNAQYYTLDEDGLELIFATKEFYNEFQLSINQLILRKQLEKGEFKGALRQINEMRIDVESLQERIVKLKHEIQRSIVSEETFERYKELLEDINKRLEREDEEFEELRIFVKETKERLYAQEMHEKERNMYNYVLKINQQLEEVHYEHSHLLKQTAQLKNTTLISAQESLYYTGIQSFNFDQDLVSRIVSTPLPLEAMKGVLHPFLKVEQNQVWSPLTVFAEQNIVEEREERVENEFLGVRDDGYDDEYRQFLAQKYSELMGLFLRFMEEEKGNCLSQFIDYLEQQELRLYKYRYFYDFWLILHQRSPIIPAEKEDGKTTLNDALSHLNGRVLYVTEDAKIIQKIDRYSIQEMKFELEAKDDGLFGE